MSRLRVLLLLLSIGGLARSTLSPSMCEMHALTARLFFHLNNRTIVYGQRAGCVLYHIPNVALSEDVQQAILGAASDDAGVYLLALLHCRQEDLPLPPLALARHPAGLWATLQTVAQYNYYFSTRIDRPPPPAVRHRLLEILRELRTQDPENAAIPLAEAAIEFHANDTPAAMAALVQAASATTWDNGAARAQPSALRLQQEFGLPMFDAACTFRKADASLHVAYLVHEGLAEYLFSAVREHRDVDFAFGAELDERIGAIPAQRAPHIPHIPALEQDDVLIAMVSRLCSLPDPSDTLMFAVSSDQTNGVVSAYLDRFAPPELSERVAARQEQQVSSRRFLNLHDFDEDHDVAQDWTNASLAGVASLLLFVFGLATLLLQIPFILAAGDERMAGVLPRSGKFWIASALMLAIGTALLTLALNSLIEPIGLRTQSEAPPASSLTYQLLFAGILAFALFLLKLVLVNPNRRVPIAGIGLCTILLLYVTSTALAAHYRSEFISRTNLHRLK